MEKTIGWFWILFLIASVFAMGGDGNIMALMD